MYFTLNKIFYVINPNEYLTKYIRKEDRESKKYSGYLYNAPKSKNGFFISKTKFC